MDLTAIVLCGEGKHLHPIASVRSGAPKALLPVANRPLLAYSLEWIEKLPLSKILVLAYGPRGSDIKSYVEEQYEKKSDTSIEVVMTENQYSGELIASQASRIKEDFVVFPCDFISGDMDPQIILKEYYNRDQSNVLVTGIYYQNTIDTIEKKALNFDYVVHTSLRDKDPKLLDVYSKESVHDNKRLELRTSMMWRHANSVVSTNLLNASIYICNHKVLELINSEAAALEDNGSDGGDNDDECYDKVMSISVINKSWPQVVRDIARRSWRHKSSCEHVCMCVLEPGKVTFIRANNLSSYLESNRYIMKLHAAQIGKGGGIANSAAGKGGASGSVGSDSLVGIDTSVGQKTTVKKTVVGNNCFIGSKCRITGCVILDGVNIQDEVVLENCLIGKQANIGTKSKLTGCNVEGGYQVLTGFQAKGETLQNVNIEGIIDEAMTGNQDYDDGDNVETDDLTDEESEEESDLEHGWSDDEEDDFSGDDFFER